MTLRDDCFLHDEDRLSHEAALSILRERITPIMPAVPVRTADAAGRILAADVIAPRNIPAHTNSAVDGYALRFADYDPANGARLPVSGRAAAGHGMEDPLPPRSAVRIFTGAPMPAGADTVVMQEDVKITQEGGKELVSIPAGLKLGANCRHAGEDVKEGATLLRAGCRLRPQEIAAAASAGLAALDCFERLRVAIYSTGDEIVRPGEALAAGQVYDANAPMLHGLIAATGAECIDLGILPDTADAVRGSLMAAAEVYDVV
ncbi:MAG: molybdopterin molybdenumtransferase MoeA, partial [Alphaproteobacteria bacterium]